MLIDIYKVISNLYIADTFVASLVYNTRFNCRRFEIETLLTLDISKSDFISNY